MKIILSLLILISLFSYLLAGTITCPSLEYICCSSSVSTDSCKCLNKALKKKCQTTISCNLPKKPILTIDKNGLSTRCI